MRKVLFLLTMCVSLACYAQTHPLFGLKGGVNFTNLIAKNHQGGEFQSRTSFHVGGLVQLPLNQQFTLQPEVLFSSQSAKYHSDYFGDDVGMIRDIWHLNYLNLPLMGQYLFGNGFSLQTGPQLGFLLSAKTKDDFGEQEFTQLLKTVEVSWAMGTAYTTKMGLGLDIRYNLGLTDIDDTNGISAKNRVLQAGLFYLFGKEHKK